MNGKQSIRVGLVGNPNTGKTTLFNAITGSRQKTGNYAGVTVEKKEGRRDYKGVELIVYDLPGTYSLTAYSEDEIVTRDFILDERPDIIIDVLDATNLERNLYLFLQVRELGVLVVGAVNIVDQAKSMGIEISFEKLSGLLGIPLVKTVGTSGNGVNELLDTVIATVNRPFEKPRQVGYGSELEAEIAVIQKEIEKDRAFAARYVPRWFAVKLLEKDANVVQKLKECGNRVTIEKKIAESIRKIERHFGSDAEIVVSQQRYAYIRGGIKEAITIKGKGISLGSEKADMVLMDRFLGLPIFLAIVFTIFQITFVLGKYPSGWLESLFSFISVRASGVLPEGMLRSLIVDGIIGGLSGVLSFVPLIAILFLCISILEDTGYMARAAFISDKFLHVFGLHGQSFVPLMLGFGCSVPAVMAARALKSPRDRIITIIVTPFMTCGAKLVVLLLLAGTFFEKNQSLFVMSIYLIGVILALLSSLLLRKTILKGETTPFVMELPPYRIPTVRGIVWHVLDKTGQYLKKAGTVLLAASILIWAIVSFPKQQPDKVKDAAIASQARSDHPAVSEEEIASIIKNNRAEEALAFSIAGRIGKGLEPLFKPVGFDWKIGISAITGFAAKEAVVSTLGVLYKVGEVLDGKSATLKESLRADKTFTKLVAFVLMLFTLIVPPCISALSVIRSEIGWRWLAFAAGYMIVLAWGLCFSVFQTGKLLGLGG